MSFTSRSKCFVKYFSSSYFNSRSFSKVSCVSYEKDKSLSIPPYFNLDKRLNNISSLNKSLELRNLEFDVISLTNIWKEYKQLKDTKLVLLEKKKSISDKISTLRHDDSEESKRHIQQLKRVGKMTRDDLKNIETTLLSLGKSLIKKSKMLPNDLDSSTTSIKTVIEYHNHLFKSPSNNPSSGSSDLGITYDGSVLYLRKFSALFELAVVTFFKNELYKRGYIAFSNPDTVRAVVLDGFDPTSQNSVITLDDKSTTNAEILHLTGGASILPFLAFHARKNVVEKDLPLRYVTKGRLYSPFTNIKSEMCCICQSSAVHIFIASSEDNVNNELENVKNLVSSLYQTLGLHFRVSRASATQLKLSEKLKYIFEVYSSTHEEFIEIGNLSLYGDIISKRLRMHFLKGNTLEFIQIIDGTIFRFSSLLYCLTGCDKKIIDNLIVSLRNNTKFSFINL